MEYSMTFLARGVWGSLPMVTMSGPAWTIFSTSRRILRKSMSRFFRTLAATPEPSLTSPSRICSVPMYSWLSRCASWLASCITLRARSVKRSYISYRLRQVRSRLPGPRAWRQDLGGATHDDRLSRIGVISVVHPFSARKPRGRPRVGPTDDVALVQARSEEHTSELQSRRDLVCRLLLE